MTRMSSSAHLVPQCSLQSLWHCLPRDYEKNAKQNSCDEFGRLNVQSDGSYDKATCKACWSLFRREFFSRSCKTALQASAIKAFPDRETKLSAEIRMTPEYNYADCGLIAGKIRTPAGWWALREFFFVTGYLIDLAVSILAGSTLNSSISSWPFAYRNRTNYTRYPSEIYNVSVENIKPQLTLPPSTRSSNCWSIASTL